MKTVDFTHFPLHAGERVLDVGCGEGRHSIAAYIEGEVQVVGLDLVLTDLHAARDKFAPFAGDRSKRHSFGLVAGDALQLPFADNSFDKVICSEVLEHIGNYKGVLKEISRVLRPGGAFCASVPRCWPEKICWALSEGYYQVPGGHVHIFRAGQLRRQIEQCGFSRYHQHGAHALHTPFWWLKCLCWQRRDSHWLIRQYHRLLVWDMMQQPVLTRAIEHLLNPVLGKSVVLYFYKEAAS
ncbi:MAG: methyltransferase domain-containing protein [Parahaliea sp.]